MRVLQINSVFHFGSTGRITEDLYREFIEKGFNSYVICTNLEDEEHNIYQVGSFFEGKIHALLTRLLGLRGYFSFFSTMKMIRKIRRINPDVIILHNLHNNYVSVPALLSFIAKKNIKTIWVLHDCWAFTGGCTHYTVYHCNEWLTGCKKCRFSRNAFNSWFFNTSSKQYKDRVKYFNKVKDLTIVGVSDWITKEAQKSLLNLVAKRIRRIYNWIDAEMFYPRESFAIKRKLNLSESDFVVLGVAQIWGEDKGISRFINVAKALPHIQFVIIGKLTHSVPTNVIPVGIVSDIQELAEYYSVADVFVNFTQQEAFGNVTAEAMACGTPIIINNNTACPEVVGDECGFLIANNDEKACIDAIMYIRRVGKKTFRDRCVERSREMFLKELIMKQWLNLINEVVNF